MSSVATFYVGLIVIAALWFGYLLGWIERGKQIKTNTETSFDRHVYSALWTARRSSQDVHGV